MHLQTTRCLEKRPRRGAELADLQETHADRPGSFTVLRLLFVGRQDPNHQARYRYSTSIISTVAVVKAFLVLVTRDFLFCLDTERQA